ncbi:hypothetical protein VOLCADRAFT_88188 [Volvox carteri f. nagariensis]|uniref:Glycosyl hydrolase family 32 N-terminal domain-containing protein n=1 Tax=Volvox carteri f. nagariensis TaxID=3068 RepID=D8TNI3_VOLCA|nr:uncharacterized protein VOLCADRAFT_88188 [Volvox carteri f. nagariensis]EFJ50845.1 hypothetical protein VOLCADRAFT_88188 [Volvox carteri f. nagariensis]|eukprot:XP_002947857.1 hypothetical protein VOLCADRAFT_88188 [Volvox carteri f. nagariensis]
MELRSRCVREYTHVTGRQENPNEPVADTPFMSAIEGKAAAAATAANNRTSVELAAALRAPEPADADAVGVDAAIITIICTAGPGNLQSTSGLAGAAAAACKPAALSHLLPTCTPHTNLQQDLDADHNPVPADSLKLPSSSRNGGGGGQGSCGGDHSTPPYCFPSPSHDRDQESLKPMFHVMPVSGWGSDPNGPIFYKGRYHLFYQARPGTCQWHWGVGWDHVVSYDLAHWDRLPPAIFPTPGGPDADGCFSGSIAVEPRTGVPVCFYTGARLRTNREVPLPHPPPSHDMGLPHFEAQCCAVCDPDDELLVKWRKVPMPLMELPHTGQLTAWRDPWFVEQGDGRGREWTMLIGSGLKDGGGTALVYRTQDITRGWRFVGDLCSWPNPKMGVVWECPFLVQLQPLPLCAHVLPTTDLAGLMEAEGEEGEGEEEAGEGEGEEREGEEEAGEGEGEEREHMVEMEPMATAVAAAGKAEVEEDGLAEVVEDIIEAKAFGPKAAAAAKAEEAAMAPTPPTLRTNDALKNSGEVEEVAEDGFQAAVRAEVGSVMQTMAVIVYEEAEVALAQTGTGAEAVEEGEPSGVIAGRESSSGASDTSMVHGSRLECTASGSSSLRSRSRSGDSGNGGAVGDSETASEWQRQAVSSSIGGGGGDKGGYAAEVPTSLVEAVRQTLAAEPVVQLAAMPQPVRSVDIAAAEPVMIKMSVSRTGCADVAAVAELVDALLQAVTQEQQSTACTATKAAAVESSSAIAAAHAAATEFDFVTAVAPAAAVRHGADVIDFSVIAAAPWTAPADLGSDASTAIASITVRRAVSLLPSPVLENGASSHAADAGDASGGGHVDPRAPSVPAAAAAATADEEIAAAAPGQAPIVRSCCLTSSTLTASATVPAAAAADRAVLQDLHFMVTQVMEARRARAGAAAAAAAEEEDAALRGDSGGTMGSVTASGGKLSYSPGVMGHSAVPEPDTEVEPLPAPVTMRYHKAQPLRPLTATVAALSAGCGTSVATDLRCSAAAPDALDSPQMLAATPANSATELDSPASAPAFSYAAAVAAAAAATATAATASIVETKPTVELKPKAVRPNADAASSDFRIGDGAMHVQLPLLNAGGSGGVASGGTSPVPTLARAADVASTTRHAFASSVPQHRRWLFGNAPDACHISGDLVGTRPIYWIGEYDSTAAKYDIANAVGAAPLDIGNCLYAPACFQDAQAYNFLSGSTTCICTTTTSTSCCLLAEVGTLLPSLPPAQHEQGRHILWGYMKELRRVPPAPALCDKYSYAGCVSLPRALYLRGDKLFQLPLPELTALRSDVAVHFSRVSLTHGSPWRLMGLRGLHLDLEMAISPGTAHRTVVLLRSWRPRGRGAAALVYDWTSRRLYVVFEAMHPSRQALWRGEHPPAGASTASAMTPPPSSSASVATTQPQQQGPHLHQHHHHSFPPDLPSELIRADPDLELSSDTSLEGPLSDEEEMVEEDTAGGGDLDLPPGSPLRLRVFLDASCLEVFTGSGQVLTTRVYRGHAPHVKPQQPQPHQQHADPGIEVWSVGGSCSLDDLHAYEMDTAWLREGDAPLDGFVRK